MSKHIAYEGFGQILEEAEALGFDADALEDEMWEAYGLSPDDPGGDFGYEHARCDISDTLEEEAIEFLRNLGFTIVGYDDPEEDIR